MTFPLDHDELLLLAFRYLAGELSAAESEAFEARLADDEPAQQALADVVQVSAALGAGSGTNAPTCVPVVAGRNVRRRQIAAAALAGGTIACGVLLLTADWNSPPSGPGTAASDVTPRQARSMVALWNELQFEEPERPLADEQLSSLTSDDEADPAEVPDWMLAAVAGLEPGDLPESEADSRPGDTPPELDEEVL
jgi:ferric-dicitrate binding protein FerR (iron transport regulator)